MSTISFVGANEQVHGGEWLEGPGFRGFALPAKDLIILEVGDLVEVDGSVSLHLTQSLPGWVDSARSQKW